MLIPIHCSLIYRMHVPLIAPSLIHRYYLIIIIIILYIMYLHLTVHVPLGCTYPLLHDLSLVPSIALS